MFGKTLQCLGYGLALLLIPGQLSCNSYFDDNIHIEDYDDDDDFCPFAHCDPREPANLIPPVIVIDIDPNGGKVPLDVVVNIVAAIGYPDIRCPNTGGFVDYGYIAKIEWRILPEQWNEENSVIFTPSILDSNTALASYSFARNFKKPGDYQVEIRVTDDCGNIATHQEIIPVRKNRCPDFKINCTGCVGEIPLKPVIEGSADFYETEFDPDDDVLYWEIDYDGDGQAEVGPIEIEDDGAPFQDDSAEYAFVGQYQILITVEDQYQCRTTATVEVIASSIESR